ncbi:MAG: O-antigen ligase family protein [Methylococcales bacterium]
MNFLNPMNGATPSTGKQDPVVRAGAFFAALLMLTVPLSTTISIVMTFLVFACWILSARFRSLPILVRRNPVAASALLLYGLLLVGTLYGDAATADSLSMLRKYRELPLLVILLPFMQEEKYRRWAITAFIIASVVTLMASYWKEFGIFPMSQQGTPPFKSRITHNLFMAFLAYFCAHRAKTAVNQRVFWVGLCLLATFNLFIIVQGRTGQVIFVLLIALFFFQRFKVKLALILASLVLLGFLATLAIPGSGNRFEEGIEESRDYLQGRRNLGTSMGQRLYFWQNSIDLISKSPIVGYGTGSFAREFSGKNGGKDLITENPHNEYLMIAVQLGGIGLFAYLFFLASLWRCSFDLSEDRRWFAQGVFLSLAVNSLLNTTFLDHTEGHWYASLIALSFAALPRNCCRTATSKFRREETR